MCIYIYIIGHEIYYDSLIFLRCAHCLGKRTLLPVILAIHLYVLSWLTLQENCPLKWSERRPEVKDLMSSRLFLPMEGSLQQSESENSDNCPNCHHCPMRRDEWRKFVSIQGALHKFRMFFVGQKIHHFASRCAATLIYPFTWSMMFFRWV